MSLNKGLAIALASVIAATVPTMAVASSSAVAAEGVGVLSFSAGDCPPHSVSITLASQDLASAVLAAGGSTWHCSAHVAYKLEDCAREGTALACHSAAPALPGFTPILEASFVMEDSGYLSFEAYGPLDNGIEFRTVYLEGHVVPLYVGQP